MRLTALAFAPSTGLLIEVYQGGTEKDCAAPACRAAVVAKQAVKKNWPDRLQQFRRAVHAGVRRLAFSRPRALGLTGFSSRARSRPIRTYSLLRSASPSRISQARPNRWGFVCSSRVRPLQRINIDPLASVTCDSLSFTCEHVLGSSSEDGSGLLSRDRHANVTLAALLKRYGPLQNNDVAIVSRGVA